MQKSTVIDGADRYPVTGDTPTYVSDGKKIVGATTLTLADIFEFICVAVAVALTIWLGYLLALKSASWSVSSLGWLILFWAVMAYLALPRLHQCLTKLYVPNYFISRTRTADGLLGDPVNLALDGTSADIEAAMAKAGWTKADEITLGSAWGIIKSSLFGRSYPQAPVSDLFLFGRRHAFAYQQEVNGSATHRHHIRFWPTPEGWALPGGYRVGWLAAATYDRAVGLSGFTGQVTHKIDANIDLERDYVINTVRHSDPECSVTIIKEFSTAYHHRNGGGDLVYTDGDLPILDVSNAFVRANSAAATAENSPDSNARPTGFAEQIEAAKKHHIPAVSFLVTGLFLFLANFLLVFAWLQIDQNGQIILDGENVDILEISKSTVALFLMLIFWVLTLLRLRWARIGLMLIAIIGTISDLLAVSISGHISTSALLSAAASVLILWAITAPKMRQWVLDKKKNS